MVYLTAMHAGVLLDDLSLTYTFITGNLLPLRTEVVKFTKITKNKYDKNLNYKATRKTAIRLDEGLFSFKN